MKTFHLLKNLLALTLAGLCLGSAQAASRSEKLPVAPKWGRFEATFKSAYAYSNAVQDVTLRVQFRSPLGETTEVFGFWDGGRTWKARFKPDQPGRWTYKTICSDTANRGLEGVAGAFLCTSSIGRTRFSQHGPVRVDRDHRHFVHADGTPFLWLADTTWDGARLSKPLDWSFYVETRAAQSFTVVQWAVSPGDDSQNESAFLGNDERVTLNPAFFQRLDAKVEAAWRAGLLNAIVPSLELDPKVRALPDDQMLVLTRYIVARYGGDPVVWLLAIGGEADSGKVGRWRKIGEAVFADPKHAPVVLFAGEHHWILDEFRNQKWVDAFGMPAPNGLSDDTLKWTFAGPFAKEWTREPARPLVAFAPTDNSPSPDSAERYRADDVRRAIYWGLLLAPPAGVSYTAKGVVDWDPTVEPTPEKKKPVGLPMWKKSLFLPAAKQVEPVARLLKAADYARLVPEPRLVAIQPGTATPRLQILGAASEDKARALVYVPNSKTVDLNLEALPGSPAVTWFNPRTGESTPAVAVVGGKTCQLPTPGAGDWVLVVNAGRGRSRP